MKTKLSGNSKSYLSNKDREDICSCVMDLESGNHLLGRPRPLSHMALIIYLAKLSERDPINEAEEEIKMYFKGCTDEAAMEEYKKKYEIV